ncbi:MULTISPECIES: hypothetical protein [unclassified Aerococcus]|uniref:hypothetical protein n=1 Tax=unclassified Aerococcus TaxID=2618060 RepID=UPI0025C2A834|nr:MULTISPECIES: hypothetical protein [unclassified Aerococcus]
MDWQYVIERIAVNAGYIVTIFTAIKYFVLNPLEKRRKKEDDEKIAEQNAFQERILQKTSENQKPLVEALDSLKQLIEDTRRDSDNLHKITDVNVKAIGELDEEMDNHDKRIYRLEVKNGFIKMEEEK